MRTTHLPLLLLTLACCLLWVPATEGGSLQHRVEYPAQRRTSYNEAANSYNRHEARTAETEKMKRFIARILNSDESLKAVQKKDGAVQEVDTRRLLDLVLKDLATRGHHLKRQDVTTTTTTPTTTTLSYEDITDESEATDESTGDQEESISDPTENGLNCPNGILDCTGDDQEESISDPTENGLDCPNGILDCTGGEQEESTTENGLNWQDGALDCTGGDAVSMREDTGYKWNPETAADCDKAKKEGSIVVPAEMTFTWHEGSLYLDEGEVVGSFLIPTGVRVGYSEVDCDKGEEEIPLNLEDLDELAWLDAN